MHSVVSAKPCAHEERRERPLSRSELDEDGRRGSRALPP